MKLSNGRAVLVTNPGHTESVRLLLEAGADKDKRDGQGRTALIEASLGNHAEIAQLLLEARADVHALDNFGRTALHCASSCGYMAIVDSLLEAGGTAEKNSGRADCQAPQLKLCNVGALIIRIGSRRPLCHVYNEEPPQWYR